MNRLSFRSGSERQTGRHRTVDGVDDPDGLHLGPSHTSKIYSPSVPSVAYVLSRSGKLYFRSNKFIVSVINMCYVEEERTLLNGTDAGRFKDGLKIEI